MSCNQDSECLKISKNYIDNAKSIKDYGNKISSNLDEIITQTSSLDVPDDYIGTKISDKIVGIINMIQQDSLGVENTISEISMFANEKSEEHLNHYNDWIRMQEEIARKRKENSQIINQNELGDTNAGIL